MIRSQTRRTAPARLPFPATLVLALAATAFAREAHAQTDAFRVDRYLAPATTEDGVALQLPDTLGHLRWSAGLVLDYAHGTLVASNGTDTAPIVEHLFGGQLVGALGLAEMFEIHLRFPIVFVQAGSSPNIGGTTITPDTAALGDGAIGGSVRFFGDARDGLALGLAAELLVPMGTGTSLTSDTEVGARGHLMASFAVPRAITVALLAGGAYRPARDYLGARIGPELSYGLGLYFPVIEEFTLLGELWGSTGLREDQTFTKAGTPLEALLGARANIEGVSLTGSVGFGLTQSVGTPDVRALLGVGYAPPVEEPVAGPGDRDGDGILDDVDRCPDEPEDRDGFEGEDGCPDPDNDQDGIVDATDQCPMEPEDRDQFEDENGCPDPDNDQDQILDVSDQCPLEPEDRDGFEDDNGCPDPDNDRDGFADATDQCPMEPETVNQFEDDDGCPDVEPELTELNALGMRVFFPHDGVNPTERSMPVLRQVARLLNQHPEWERIQLDAHTDTSGGEAYNLELSRRRAERVRDLLVRQGVDADRLVLVAHGEASPAVEETDEAAMAQNRRLEFTILQRAAPPPAAE